MLLPQEPLELGGDILGFGVQLASSREWMLVDTHHSRYDDPADTPREVEKHGSSLPAIYDAISVEVGGQVVR